MAATDAAKIASVFFLEYDRGTERSREYVAKLDADYWYRDSGRAPRDYEGFPTVLFVTTAARAESEFAHLPYLAAERHGHALPLLLTTTMHIDADVLDPLGPIWRCAAPLGTRSAANLSARRASSLLLAVHS